MPRASKEERLAQARECLDSGMPLKDWCEQNGVSKTTLYPWVLKLRKQENPDPTPTFVEIKAKVEPVAPAAPIIARIGQVDIFLASGFDEADAAAAMRAAATL